MANTNEVKVTFESIYEILREEKKREDLGKLDLSFLADVSVYLQEKTQSVLPDDELSQKQLSNIKRMITEIFERREAKIVKLAMHCARMKTNFVDKSKLLDSELAMFNDINTTIRTFRENNLDKVIKGHIFSNVQQKSPSQDDERTLPSQKHYERDSVNSKENVIEEDIEEPRAKIYAQSMETKDLKKDESFLSSEEVPEKDNIRVVFTREISKFVGENMEIFGPFAKDDQAVLPKKIAHILVNRQQAKITTNQITN